MTSTRPVLLIAGALLAAALTQGAPPTSGQVVFAPFEQWKAAVITGDQAALARLYSTKPPAVAKIGRDKDVTVDEECRFWAGLRSSGLTEINPKVLEVGTDGGMTRLLLRIEAVKAGSQPVVASMLQFWTRQPDGWRIAATQRGEFSPSPVRRLPQPATPNTSLYPEPGHAEQELKAASATALEEHKRVLVVFGANWCYDCHVLDTTFHSREFAPLVEANYVIAHINIGDEGKDNRDMAARLGVSLDYGIPSLAVLEPDGRVVVAQKNGEFESTVKIGPEEVRAFLEKWKPAR